MDTIYTGGDVYVGSRTPMNLDDWLNLGWTRDDAQRLLDEAPQTAARVLKITADGIEPLRHVVRHSPSGLEWGYGGSGPADLALSIVCDHLGLRGKGRHSHALVTADGRQLYREPPYMDFKWQHIATLPQQGAWLIPVDLVAAWLTLTRWQLEDAIPELDDDEAGAA